MKRCPQCNQTFEDATDFCVDDGAPLQSFSSFVSADIPTQVLAPVARRSTTQNGSGKLLYIALGAMGVVIIGLAAMLLYRSPVPDDVAGVKPQDTPAPRSTAAVIPPVNTAKAVQSNESLPITEEDASQLITRWERSQDARNFTAYRSCYAPAFIGIKRTPAGGREQRTFDGWMADRGKMLRNIVEVRVENRRVSIDGDAAVVEFVQHFRSVNYCDVGDKTIRIKMFADGPKIVFEELKNPVGCS